MVTAPAEQRSVHFCSTLCVPRQATTVALVREAVSHTLALLGVEQACVDDIRLALSEACTNVVEHATSAEDYEVDMEVDERQCTISVRNTGGGFDPASIDRAMPPPDASRGRGLAIMQAVMDSVQLESAPGSGSVVNLARHLTLRPDATLGRTGPTATS